MGLVEAMKQAGTGLLFDLMRLNLNGADMAWFVAGSALSAWVAWRGKPRRQA